MTREHPIFAWCARSLRVADCYARAAQRCQQFDVIPEQGWALAGQVRRPTARVLSAEETQALQHVRGIFEIPNAAAALTDTDALVRRPDARSA